MAPRVVSGGQLADIEAFVPGSLSGMAFVDPGTPLAGYFPGKHDPNAIYTKHISVRRVVDFIADHMASTGFAAHQMAGDETAPLPADHPLSLVLRNPSPARPAPADGRTPAIAAVPPATFWRNIILDWLLWDRWCVLSIASLDASRNGLDLMHIPSARFRFYADTLGRIYGVWVGGTSGRLVDPANCVYDYGFSPGGANGTSPIVTLEGMLDEERAAQEFKAKLYEKGARIPGVITRPALAPEWSKGTADKPSARTRFLEQMKNWWHGGGAEGELLLLEDGMTLTKSDIFSPRDLQDTQARQLSSIDACSAYHIPPEMIGVRQGNYSNVAAFREALYGDTLGPYFDRFVSALNAFLVPQFGDPTLLIVDNRAVKIRGDFITMLSSITSGTGGPILTRDEGRGFFNLKPLGGEAAKLITPLNVAAGGLASPHDTAPKATTSGQRQRLARKDLAEILAKADSETDLSEYEQELAAFSAALRTFYGDQAAQVLAALPDPETDVEDAAAIQETWDQGDWDALLKQVIGKHSVTLATIAAQQTLSDLGAADDAWSIEGAAGWLDKAAGGHAIGLNARTLGGLIGVGLAGAGDFLGDGERMDSESGADATTIGTESRGFASNDAAGAAGAGSKTWVTGGNPRSEHDSMDGETVPLDSEFSNGGRYPGDPSLGPEDNANCNCEMTFSMEGTEG